MNILVSNLRFPADFKKPPSLPSIDGGIDAKGTPIEAYILGMDFCTVNFEFLFRQMRGIFGGLGIIVQFRHLLAKDVYVMN